MDHLASCGHGEVLDYETATCKDICPKAYHLKDGFCQFTEETCEEHMDIEMFQHIQKSENVTKQLAGKTFMLLGRAMTPCYKCKNVTVINANTTDIHIAADGTIKYKTNKISPNLVYHVDPITSYVCLDGVIMTVPETKTYIGEVIATYLLLSISIISLILYFVAYVVFKRLRNVPGKIVAGNMMCLFFAYVFFLARHVPGLEGTSGCTAVAILINYFFLASFVFNIIYAGFIVRSLDFIDFEANANQWTAMRLWLVGLLVPLAVIAPGIVLDNMPPSDYQPKYGGSECFIDSQLGKVIYFVGPVGVSLFISIVLYLVIIVKLVQLAKETSMVRSNHSEKISVAMKLVVVLGFNWIFALIAALDQGKVTTLIFIVTCTLQGFFGFAVFICNETTLKDIKKCLNKNTSLNFEMSSNARASAKHTRSTDITITKNLLRQVDSNKALLKTTADDLSV